MKKVLLALLGLVLLVMLSFFCYQDKVDTIKKDLVSSTSSALVNHNITGVNVTLKGMGLEITDIMQLKGKVPSQALKMQAQSIAEGIEGVGSIDNQIIVAAETPKVIAKVT